MDLPNLKDELRALMEDEALEPELRARREVHLRGLSPQTSPPDLPPRYRHLAPIGRGGMGEVFRVWDERLERSVALKVLGSHRAPSPTLVDAFILEAKGTAQLQHPGIVPVHDVGLLPDGRPFFTMKEVTGRTLSSIIQASRRGAGGWTTFRLITTLQRVAATLAFAHTQGVVHRDLKPSNIMVGEFGEVMVMDWGLAVYRDALEASNAEDPSLPPSGKRVGGTPAYMAPEQALGDLGAEAPGVDVYALGAILYEILTGRPPYLGRDPRVVLAQVRLGAPPPPDAHPLGEDSPTLDTQDDLPPPHADPRPLALPRADTIPQALRALCERAIQRRPEDRPPSAGHISDELQAWLDGARRREAGLVLIHRADALLPEIAHIDEQIATLREDAKTTLASLEGSAPGEDRYEAWSLQDQAHAKEEERDLKELTYLQCLRGALTHDPDLPEAHSRLASYYARHHKEAEEAGELRQAVNLEVLLRTHDRQGEHQAYLTGQGALTIVTDPPGALVHLHRLDAINRYLTPTSLGPLGETPIDQAPLPMGTYLLTLTHPDCEEVSYPVFIQRLTHWDGVRPGDTRPYALPLPPKGSLGSDEVYIPPGFFWCGGDRDTLNALPRRRIWLDGFIMGRYPVRVAAYLDFLNALIKAGRIQEALRWAPREGEEGAPIFSRGSDGLFTLGVDKFGIHWQGDWPIVLIDWPCAKAYAAFEAGRTGLSYRMPWEMEWEKAARGVDGRTFPWGETFNPAWACIHTSHPGQPTLPTIYQYPMDKGPYGVQGMAGGVRDWCRDGFTKGGYPVGDGGIFDPNAFIEPSLVPLRVNRGGGWLGPERFARTAFRYGYSPAARYASLGMRLCRSYP